MVTMDQSKSAQAPARTQSFRISGGQARSVYHHHKKKKKKKKKKK